MLKKAEREAYRVFGSDFVLCDKLYRFIQAHGGEDRYTSFRRALEEIQAGKKTTDWIWYIIPTPPHKGDASPINKMFALSDEEAIAFCKLNF